MSFGTTTFRKPKSKVRPVSTKWVDLQPRERKAPGMKRIGAKGEFWIFVGEVINLSFAKIGLLDTCEIQNEVCDGYHRAWAHTRRRQDIRRLDWKYAFRVVRACQECHYFADALQEGRTNSEILLEAVRAERNKRLGLTEEAINAVLLESAAEIQAKDLLTKTPRFQAFVVEL